MDRIKAFFGDGAEVDGDHPMQIGRYEILREIARGGMAVVYEARDPELQRTVALKVLKEENAERLLREATTAARLRHPNIVTIYEVGPSYIAMEHLVGRTLGQLLPGLSKIEAVRVLETVARAIDHAHGAGVVHRDLKPDNVIVEDSGRVVITDFGLAKTFEGADLARRGSAIGTPHYMAPEQVRGQLGDIGPPADVWALGVMLGEVVLGRKPFDAPSVPSVYHQIVREDPPPMPEPLGAIALRAIQKEITRRYPSAQALADDLARYLAGDPVTAMPIGPWRRTWGRVRKQRTFYALALAAGLGCAAAVGLALAGRADRRKVVESVREQARVSLQAAIELRRAGAVARTRQFLPPLESAYREAQRRVPGLAEPDYLMGRMHRVLLEDDRALALQERALTKDPHFVPALYERAVLLSATRERAAEPTRGGDAGRPLRAWETFLAEAGPDGARASSALGPGALLLAQGLVAHYRGRHAEARDAVDRALTLDAALDEGWEALTWVVQAEVSPVIADQERSWSGAEAIYSERIERDRGYVPNLIGRGRLRQARGDSRRHRGVDPAPDYRAAIADFTQAIALEPRSADAWSDRGQARAAVAVTLADRDEDPRPACAEAEADLSRAIALDAGLARAWMWRGSTRYYRGTFLAQQRQDPMDEYVAAERDLSEALRVEPGLTRALRWRARVRAQRAETLAGAGADPTEILGMADRDFARHAERVPDDSRNWMWWSDVALEQAEAHWRHGADPLPDFATAEKRLDRAIALEPEYSAGWRKRGALHLRIAAYLDSKERRTDARDRRAAAARDMQHAVSLDPRLPRELKEPLEEARRRAAETF